MRIYAAGLLLIENGEMNAPAVTSRSAAAPLSSGCDMEPANEALR